MDKQGVGRLLSKALVDPQFAEILQNAPEAAAKAQELTLSEADLALLQETNWSHVVMIGSWLRGLPLPATQEPSSDQVGMQTLLKLAELLGLQGSGAGPTAGNAPTREAFYAKAALPQPSRALAPPSAKQPSLDLASRPLYFDGIREVIREGDLSRMKRVFGEANDLLRKQGDLQLAVKVLQEAIKVRESER